MHLPAGSLRPAPSQQQLSQTAAEHGVLCILRPFAAATTAASPCRPGDHGARPFSCALISSNLARARSNLSLNSHIASRISRKVAEVRALSALPKVNMLLL